MVCKFCGQEKKLIKAHIIPKKFYLGLKGDRYLCINSQNCKYMIQQQGGYDSNILCGDCDNHILGEFDKEGYQVHGVLIPSTKSISIDNISSGVQPVELFISSGIGDKIEYWFSFFISRKDFFVNYRCIVYVTDTNNNIILANYDEPEIDHSVYETAKKEREDPDKMLNDYIRQDYDNLISAIESDRKIQEDKDRQDTIDSTIQDIKDYGQKFIEDPYFQKIIAVFGGVFFVVLFFSLLSVLMGLRK